MRINKNYLASKWIKLTFNEMMLSFQSFVWSSNLILIQFRFLLILNGILRERPLLIIMGKDTSLKVIGRLINNLHFLIYVRVFISLNDQVFRWYHSTRCIIFVITKVSVLKRGQPFSFFKFLSESKVIIIEI